MNRDEEARDFRLERDAVAMALRDTGYATRALPVLEGRDFLDENARWIWGRLAPALRETGELPDVEDWLDWAEADFKARDPVHHEGVVAYLGQLLERRVPRPNLALKHLSEVMLAVATRQAAENMIDSLEKGDHAKAVDAATSLLKADQAASGLEEPLIWSRSYQARLRRYRHGEASPCIPTPFSTLDALLGGGIRCGVLGVVVANTNIGKSTMAVGLGYHAVAVGRAVVIHIAVEEVQEETEARYDAALSGIDRGRLLTGKIDDEEAERIEREFLTRGSAFDRLTVRSVPPFTSVAWVEALAHEVRRANPGVPMLIVIDSPDDLGAGRGNDRRSRVEQQTDVYLGVYGLAVSRQLAPIAVWATCHAGREWEGKRLKTKAVADSYTKAKKAGLVLGLTEGFKSAQTGGSAPDPEIQMVLDVLKTRQGTHRGRELHVLCDTGTCRWRERVDSAEPVDLEDLDDVDLVDDLDPARPRPVHVGRRGHLAVVPPSVDAGEPEGGNA